MNETAHEPPQESPPPPGSPPTLKEVLLIFALSAILTKAFSVMAGFSSLVGEYLFTLVAAVFLGLPYYLLTRYRRSFEDHALTTEGWPRSALVALVATVVTALPFFGGYHLWRTEVQNHRFEFSVDNYRQLPVVLEGTPPGLEAKSGPGVHLWRDGRLVFLQWSAGPGRHKTEISLESDGGAFELRSGRKWAASEAVRKRGESAENLHLRSNTARAAVHRAAFVLRHTDNLRVSVLRDGKPATASLLKLGPGGLAPEDAGDLEDNALDLSRGWDWVPLIILAQILLVALPEEYFYRGYIQTSLNKIWPKTYKILIFEIGPSILVTSVLFGLGHVVVDPRPSRMSVFFPSLLFGWLRDRDRTIVSCVLYHAACNLLVESATHHYF